MIHIYNLCIILFYHFKIYFIHYIISSYNIPNILIFIFQFNSLK